MLAVVLSPMAALAGAGGTPGPAPRDVAAAVAFRAKLGLRADRAFVGASFSNPAFDSTTWGVPLDRAEAAEVGRRAGLQRAAARALRQWSTDGAFAGAYLDQRAGGAVVFLTTGDPARARRGLGKLLPAGQDGAGVRFERARRSMAELLALQQRVNADLRGGALDAFGVTSTAIDARANAVAIGVAGDAAAAEGPLRARYGDGVTVAFEPPAQGGDAAGCESRNECPPAKGGIEIRSADTGFNCTTGFIVRVAGSPEPRILTAGHCFGASGGTGTGRVWTQAGEEIGWAEFGYWVDGGDADVALLAPAPDAIGGDRNLVFRASRTDLAPIVDWAATAEQVQGGLVCRAGAKSNYQCGTITLTNRTREVDGRTIDHQWVVDYDACPGDSGGPYLLGGVAYGIHSDSSFGCDPSTNQAWYSPIGWALEVLRQRGHPVELCTTASCGAETNVWSPRGATGDGAWEPTLLPVADGRVLKAGGLAADPLGPAGEGIGAPRPQLFDPATGEWVDTASPPWAPAECEGQFAVGLADGRVLVGGGRRLDAGDPDRCAGAHLFDPAAGPEGSWAPAAPPPVALVAAGAVLLGDGRAFVTGGAGDDGATPVALAYSPGEDAWESLAPPPAGARAPLVLRIPGGRIIVSGGHVVDGASGGLTDVAATHLYDPETDAWTATSAVGADGIEGVVLASGRVVVAGGRDLSWDGAQQSTARAAVSRFDPATGGWTQLAPLPTPRSAFTLVELSNGLLLAAGGRAGADAAPSRTADAYDPASTAWYRAPALGVARAGQGSAMLAGGAILVAGGGTSSSESYVPGDVLPPRAAAPTASLRTGAKMTSTAIPVRLSWSATDTGGSGVGTYDVARSTDGGPFSTIATRVTLPTFDALVGQGHRYRFQVRPRDWAGNAGAWRAGATISLAIVDDGARSVTYAGTWKRLTVGGYSGGGVRYTKAAGASATFRFTGRGFSFVSTRGPTMGSARIYVDGKLAGTVNLRNDAWVYRFVAFQRTWSSTGSHSVRIVALGTSGGPRVDIDAFVVLSLP